MMFPENFTKRYKVLSLIGKGAYGVVLKVSRIKDNTVLACKIFFRIFKDHVDAKRILREIYILQRLNHKNIIKVEDVICDLSKDNSRDVIYLFTPVGICDLRDLLRIEETFEESFIRYILR